MRFIHSRRFSFFKSESKRASSARWRSAASGLKPSRERVCGGGAACAETSAQSRRSVASGRRRRIETSGKSAVWVEY
jgi:hypothetical protein